jgi:hypothetical protein
MACRLLVACVFPFVLASGLAHEKLVVVLMHFEALVFPRQIGHAFHGELQALKKARLPLSPMSSHRVSGYSMLEQLFQMNC